MRAAVLAALVVLAVSARGDFAEVWKSQFADAPATPLGMDASAFSVKFMERCDDALSLLFVGVVVLLLARMRFIGGYMASIWQLKG